MTWGTTLLEGSEVHIVIDTCEITGDLGDKLAFMFCVRHQWLQCAEENYKSLEPQGMTTKMNSAWLILAIEAFDLKGGWDV